MAFSLTTEEEIARMRGDLRMGLPVVISTAHGDVLMAAVETLQSDRWQMIHGLSGPAIIAITQHRAKTLAARIYDGDLARIAIPIDADLAWLRAVADPASDLSSPLKGPFTSQRDGSADCHRAAISLCKQASLLPAAVLVPLTTKEKPKVSALNRMSLADLQAHDGKSSPVALVAKANVPLAVAQAGQVHVYRPQDGSEEHYAVEIGRPVHDKPVLLRLHSACFTGDLLGSLKCDCGAQLNAALRQIGQEGHGILLYLNQEGRGIGLANKMRAYSLQDQGFDTVEANHRLGFEDDERDFRIGAEILKAMGFSSTRLMTNNPRKVEMLEAAGVSVQERVPLRVGQTAQNADYLATKAQKSGHLL